MPTLLEIVTTVVTRSGVDIASDAVKNILNNPELTKVVVPDDVATKILGGLHNLASAEAVLSDPMRKKHHAEILNRTDLNLYLHAKEMGYDDALVDELKALPKTEDRIKVFASKIRDLEAKKVGATGKEKQDLIDSINTLKAEKSTLQNEFNDKLAQKDTEVVTELTEFAKQNKFRGYKYANEKFPNLETASVLVDKELSTLQGVAKYNKKSGKIELSKQDGTALYDAQNQLVEFDTLCDRVLSQNNMIVVSGPGGNAGNPPTTKVEGGAGGNLTAKTATVDSVVAALASAGNQ